MKKIKLQDLDEVQVKGLIQKVSAASSICSDSDRGCFNSTQPFNLTEIEVDNKEQIRFLSEFFKEIL